MKGERPGGLSADEREELARLRDENAKLRMEREISGGLLRDGGRRAVGERYSFIAAEKSNYPVAVMCRCSVLAGLAFITGSAARRAIVR